MRTSRKVLIKLMQDAHTALSLASNSSVFNKTVQVQDAIYSEVETSVLISPYRDNTWGVSYTSKGPREIFKRIETKDLALSISAFIDKYIKHKMIEK